MIRHINATHIGSATPLSVSRVWVSPKCPSRVRRVRVCLIAGERAAEKRRDRLMGFKIIVRCSMHCSKYLVTCVRCDGSVRACTRLRPVPGSGVVPRISQDPCSDLGSFFGISCCVVQQPGLPLTRHAGLARASGRRSGVLCAHLVVQSRQ